MNNVIFDEDLCQGCGLCVTACPKKILSIASEKINKMGYHPAQIENRAACIACAFCATMCPRVCITVEKE